MARNDLVLMLANRAGIPNLYISREFHRWPLVATTEEDPFVQKQLIDEFGGIIERMWCNRKEAGAQRWTVQYNTALDLLADLLPHLYGWRKEAAERWLMMGRRETYEPVADIYP